MARDPRSVRAARRAWRVVAVLYPAELRRRYGREMEEAFGDQARARARTGGSWALGWLVLVTAAGALGSRWRHGPLTGGGRVEWTREFRHAVRRLIRDPGFTTVTVLTLGLGVGAFASIAGGIAGILVEPMPYERPGDLHWVWRDYWGSFPRGWLGGPDIVRIREHDDVVEAVVAFRSDRVNLSAPGGDPTDVRVTLASPGFLETLGVAPLVGPGFTPVEHPLDAPAEAVLTHRLWQSAFGGDPGLVGRDVFLDGEAYRVAGVLPRDFDFVVHSSLGEPRPADLYVPLVEDLATWSVGSGAFAGLMRVRPGASPDAVDAALTRVSADMDGEFFGDRGFRLWRVPLQDDLVADIRPPLLAILAAALLLLLLLGANLATLFLARARRQTHDAAVRSALGAGRGSLLRTATAEALVVATSGLALGLVLSAWGSPALAIAAAEALPRSTELGFSPWNAAGAVGATLVLALLAMMGPYLRLAFSGESMSVLREGGPARSSGAGGRSRSALVTIQLALALTLIVGAGLLTRSLARLLAEDPGFDATPALTARIAFQGASYPDSASVIDAQTRFLEAVSSLPGVADAGLANALPLGMETDQTGASFPGSTVDPEILEGLDNLVDVFSVTPGYAEAVGLRILEGRALRPGDAGPLPGVVIDDVLAGRFFPDGGAVGATLVLDGDTTVVIGVVDQARFYDVARDDRGQVYLPRRWAVRTEANLVLRVEGRDPMALAPDVRRALAVIDPTLALAEVRPLSELVGEALGRERLDLWLVASFALAALVLAGLGLYGVVSGTVSRRRREIGLRMAMGAEPSRVVGMVLRQGLRLVAAGSLLGLAGAWALGRLMASLLHGIEPFDPPTYVAAAALLVLLAFLASWIPARRATRIQPSEALRAD